MPRLHSTNPFANDSFEEPSPSASTQKNLADLGFDDILSDLNSRVPMPSSPQHQSSSVTVGSPAIALDSIAQDCTRCLKLVERELGVTKNGKFYCKRCSFLV
jgi:hypothetical protein